MLLENRNLATKRGLNDRSESISWRVWKMAMLNKGLVNVASAGMKNAVVNKIFKNSWGKHRGELNFAKKSFQQLWKERN
jgi:L-lactate dehydrogenase complex protein LldF